ncbi:hypothetical protein CAPTEDRAFT_165270 [Capitella teleta]|uniref:Ergosterol biosynthetic protein 28 n=1 Tax=Capitella teleta TaxID=283909 RepID=R7THJ5_CAPTE|nr:hypothetical protein CAPTEDRAFT_165270 [Capitella teleta]|eukprot:ELT92922.1 hypothetical protein CAPTEDRAFT_165270 [Capitella teleta]
MSSEVISSGLVKYLRGWIGVVAIIAFGNTVSCFRNHDFMAEKLYTVTPELVNALTARLFGTWTLLSAMLRLWCAFCIDNHAVFCLTFFSFFLAMAHFAGEIFFYHTAELTFGATSPLVVSGLSMLWMLACYRRLFPAEEIPVERSSHRPSMKEH